MKKTRRGAASSDRPLGVTYRPGYTGAEKHKEKTSKVKMHRVESARNGVWSDYGGLGEKQAN